MMSLDPNIRTWIFLLGFLLFTVSVIGGGMALAWWGYLKDRAEDLERRKREFKEKYSDD